MLPYPWYSHTLYHAVLTVRIIGKQKFPPESHQPRTRDLTFEPVEHFTNLMNKSLHAQALFRSNFLSLARF